MHFHAANRLHRYTHSSCLSQQLHAVAGERTAAPCRQSSRPAAGRLGRTYAQQRTTGCHHSKPHAGCACVQRPGCCSILRLPSPCGARSRCRACGRHYGCVLVAKTVWVCRVCCRRGAAAAAARWVLDPASCPVLALRSFPSGWWCWAAVATAATAERYRSRLAAPPQGATQRATRVADSECSSAQTRGARALTGLYASGVCQRSE